MTDRTTDFYEEKDQTFLDANELVLNMGPQHPSTHGVLRVILKLDGEKVLNAECVIGYLHRGVEKIAENRTYAMFNPYVDRMDYVAAVSNGLGYCLAVEKLQGVEAPPRAQYIRVIMTELNRLASHQVWLGTHALDIGAITPLARSSGPVTPSAMQSLPEITPTALVRSTQMRLVVSSASISSILGSTNVQNFFTSSWKPS